VPQEPEQRMDRGEKPVHHGRDQDRWEERRDHGDDALARRAAVEFLLEPVRIGDERVLETRAPAERPPLLEPDRSQDGDEVHGLKNSLLSSRKSGVAAWPTHSNPTISRVTIRAPSCRIRASAVSRSNGRRDPTASATAKTSRPSSRRSSAVCSRHTCVSTPPTTTCGRSWPGSAPRHCAATEEKCVLPPMAVSGSSVRIAPTVGPRPLAYCSVAATGMSSRCATRT